MRFVSSNFSLIFEQRIYYDFSFDYQCQSFLYEVVVLYKNKYICSFKWLYQLEVIILKWWLVDTEQLVNLKGILLQNLSKTFKNCKNHLRKKLKVDKEKLRNNVFTWESWDLIWRWWIPLENWLDVHFR